MMKYTTGIYVGKFCPFHRGHYETLNKILEVCQKVFLVFFYDEVIEERLACELDYSMDERIEDVKQILRDKNVEIIKFILKKNLKFPDDYLEIKKNLLEQIAM